MCSIYYSPEEAGRYLEAYNVYENKFAEVLIEKTDANFVSKVTECLTTVKSINKTDSLTILSTFKSMEGIINTSKKDLTLYRIWSTEESSKGPAKKSC